MATGTIANVMPTSGSNTNGRYLKLPDGTMFCWGTATNTSSGYAEITFPVEFNAAPHIQATTRYVSGNYACFCVPQANNKTSAIIYFRNAYTDAGYTSTSAQCSWFAIGRWKA